MDLKKECYDKAVEVLEKCATRHGFNAAYPGYDAIWSRDSMITSLGASLLGDEFKNVFKRSLIVLGNNQSEHGQIPNAVDKYGRRKAHVDYQSIDSTLWFIIGHYVYAKRYKDKKLLSAKRKQIKKSFSWLSNQDQDEEGVLEQLPTTDWQDAFPHKYGHTINTHALYYGALRFAGEKNLARKVKEKINCNKDIKLWNGSFYLPWRWKNHNKYHERGEWFDSLGNLLAIIFELADEYKAKKILAHIKKNKIDLPYPVNAIYPPITRKSKDWRDYFADSEARNPYWYLNGGVWTFIGGFYVCALVKMKRFKEAERQLQKLAEANAKLDWNFSEWLHGKTGKRGEGGGQAWNAGA